MMRLAEQATLSSSDTHVGLNVFGHNTVAINLYQGLGYHTVDQSRSITF
jgi:ribosomal protein S18 acetylase RimI-like enzyme